MHLQNNRFKHFSYCLRFGGVLILTALIAGLGGILLHEFLDLIEYLVFGHGETSTTQAVHFDCPCRDYLSDSLVFFTTKKSSDYFCQISDAS